MSRKLWFFVSLLTIASIRVGFVRSAETTVVMGAVKNASGGAVVGAMVTARDNTRGVSFTVISHDGGNYAFTNLPAGKYTVQSVGAAIQSDSVDAEVTSGHKLTVNLSMNAPADFKSAASMTEYATLMPEGDAKDFIVGNCTDCHHNGLQEILYSRKSVAGWDATIEKMKNHPYGYFRSLRIDDSQKTQVRDYLAANFGTNSPALDGNKFPKTLYTGAASKVMATEFDLPSGGGAHDLAVDANGIAWVGEGAGVGVLGRLDPSTLTYTRIPIPGDKSHATALSVDSKGHVWFADRQNSRLVEYDPTSNAFNSFAIPAPPEGSFEFNTIRFHPDGSVWGTGVSGNVVVRVDPATRKVIQYTPPYGEKIHVNVTPYGMAIPKDGMVWFVEGIGERVAKIDPQTGKMTEYEVPSHASRLRRMAADVRGDVWFGEFSTGQLGMMDPETNVISEYPTPTKNSGPYSVDVDRTKNLIWVNEMMADQIASFDPRTKTFVEYPIPTRNASVRRIELDPSRPTRIWYSALNRDRVGFLDVSE